MKAVGDACVFVHERREDEPEVLRDAPRGTTTSRPRVTWSCFRRSSVWSRKRAEIETQRAAYRSVSTSSRRRRSRSTGDGEGAGRDATGARENVHRGGADDRGHHRGHARSRTRRRSRCRRRPSRSSRRPRVIKRNEIEKKGRRADPRRRSPLNAAIASLSKLQKKDIQDIKQFQNPPAGVKTCMEAVCIFFEGRSRRWSPTTRPGPQTGRRKARLLGAIQALGEGGAAVHRLVGEVRQGEHPPRRSRRSASRTSTWTRLPAGRPIEGERRRASPLCLWGHAMQIYYFIKEIEPLRPRCGREEGQGRGRGGAQEAQAKLAAVEDKLEALRGKCNASLGREEGEAREDEAERRRAEPRARGQADRRPGRREDAVGETVEKLTREATPTSSATSSSRRAFVAYLGPFTAEYRKELLGDWRPRRRGRAPAAHRRARTLQTTLATRSHPRVDDPGPCRPTRCRSRTASSSPRREGGRSDRPAGPGEQVGEEHEQGRTPPRNRRRDRRHQAEREGLFAHARERHPVRQAGPARERRRDSGPRAGTSAPEADLQAGRRRVS